MFRDMPEKTLNFYIKHLHMDDKYYNNQNLAHGKVAAVIMERDYDITDEDILNAVRFHTTGRAGMSLLEKIIYLADAIEPGRNYPGVSEIRRLAYQDVDGACLASMDSTIEYIRDRGLFLDEDTILARDYLKEKMNEQ
jgi:predicted HD superfamily hydrolase involved in NAD metabolism